MPIARIARALIHGALRRQQYRALGGIGLRGWKLDLLRAARSEIGRKRRPARPTRGPAAPG